MWRFILVCFAFLGWSFYVLSGGADYEPRATSLQARAKIDDTRPLARPVKSGEIEQQAATASAPAIGSAARSIDSLANLHLSEGQRVKIRLTSVNGGRALTAGPGSAKIRILTGGERLPLKGNAMKVRSIVQDADGNWPSAIELFRRQAALQEEMAQSAEPRVAQDPAPQSSDIRRVVGDIVNMREGPGTRYGAVEKLTRDTEVVVLQEPGNGWVELRVIGTGRVGWMADWLVTGAN